MEYLYRLPFLVLEVPNLKLKKPSWFTKPSAMVVFSFILLSYFLVTGGQINHKLFTVYNLMMYDNNMMYVVF